MLSSIRIANWDRRHSVLWLTKPPSQERVVVAIDPQREHLGECSASSTDLAPVKPVPGIHDREDDRGGCAGSLIRSMMRSRSVSHRSMRSKLWLTNQLRPVPRVPAGKGRSDIVGHKGRVVGRQPVRPLHRPLDELLEAWPA